MQDLEDNLLLFFTGFARSASAVLEDQKRRTESSDQSMLQNLHYVRELGEVTRRMLESGKTADFGSIV